VKVRIVTSASTILAYRTADCVSRSFKAPTAGFRASRWSAEAAEMTDPGDETTMPYAIIRGKSGRRHAVDFGDAPIRVEIHSSDEVVEIFIQADSEAHPEERRRFALVNVPRHLFSEATAASARRAAKTPAERFRSRQHDQE
jgi:hypothetical protein